MEIHTQVRLMWVSLEPRKSILAVMVGVASERGQLLSYPLEARECFFRVLMEEQALGWEESGRGDNMSKCPWMGMWNALCMFGKQQKAQGGCVLYQCPVPSVIPLCLQAGVG